MDARQFLETLWGNPPPGQVLLWTLPQKRSTWYINFSTVHLNINRFQDRDVYTGVGLANRAAPMQQDQALSTQAVAGIAGMWADVDVEHPVHKKSNYPPTIDDALSLLAKIPEQPTIIVHSGHGLQVWWLFHEPWLFADEQEKTQARTLAQWWYHNLLQRFQARGWTIDPTHNISRVLRVPGTINNKDRANPVPVTVLRQDGPRYHRAGLQRMIPDDFRPVFSAPGDDAPGRGSPGASAPGPVHQGRFTLDPQASPPPLALQALIDNDTTFRRTWEHNRPDMSDDSASAYDMSLARTAARYEWSDQEIVDLLIAWRREHGLELKLRQSYFRVTIAKARTPSAFAAMEQRVQRASDEVSQAELHEAARSEFAQIRAQDEALRSQDTPLPQSHPERQEATGAPDQRERQPASPRRQGPIDPGAATGASPPAPATPPGSQTPAGDPEEPPPGGVRGPLPTTQDATGAVPRSKTSKTRHSQEDPGLTALGDRAARSGPAAATGDVTGGPDGMQQDSQRQPAQAHGDQPVHPTLPSEPWSANPPKPPLTPEQRADRAQLLNTISTTLGIEILSIIKYTGDPPNYWMNTSQGSITIGEAGHIIRCSSFREAVAAATNVLIPHFKDKDWHSVAAGLLTCSEEVDVGEASDPARQTWSWITNYLADGPIIDDPQEAVTNTTPFVRHNHVHIFLDAFRRWVEHHADVKLTPYVMGQRLRQCRAKPTHASYKKHDKWTTMSCWQLPSEADKQ